MDAVIIMTILAVVLSAVTVFIDALIKQASLQNAFSGWPLLAIAVVISGLTSFGWFFVMRQMKLSTISVLYGVSCIVLLTLVSVFYFGEKINYMEIFGIVLAISSIIILVRFA